MALSAHDAEWRTGGSRYNDFCGLYFRRLVQKNSWAGLGSGAGLLPDGVDSRLKSERQTIPAAIASQEWRSKIYAFDFDVIGLCDLVSPAIRCIRLGFAHHVAQHGYPRQAGGRHSLYYVGLVGGYHD